MRNTYCTETRRGFTLVEVVITAAIAIVLMLALTYMYGEFNRTFPYLESSLAVTDGSSRIVDAVREGALQATHISAAHDFSEVTYTSGTTTVVFELPSITAAGATIAGYYDYIAVSASGTVAYRLVDAASGSVRTSGTKQLTQILESLAFTYDHTNVAQATSLFVDATTTAQAGGEVLTTHIRARADLRNL